MIYGRKSTTNSMQEMKGSMIAGSNIRECNAAMTSPTEQKTKGKDSIVFSEDRSVNLMI